MDKDIEELFINQKNKGNINIDNSPYSSFEDCSFRSNTFQSNFNTTKGRVNNSQIELSNHCNYKENKSASNINEKNNSKRLIAIKKCFQIVKSRKDLNKCQKNKCKKLIKENKISKEDNEVSIEKGLFSNTCNSFFKKNIDNFINKYLKNNSLINENMNSLNNIEKYNSFKTKNITVNKNCSLYNLPKDENKNLKEKKSNDDEKKKFKSNSIIILSKNNNDEKIKKKKIVSKKKYINVNRIETLKMKQNNYISNIKSMFNNKKEELIKNNSFCQKNALSNRIVNSKINKLFFKDSINVNSNDNDKINFNKSFILKRHQKNNINLRKRNSQNNNNLKSDNNMNNYNSINNRQKLSFRLNNQNNINNNNSDRIQKEKCNSIENNKKLDYTMTSPTIYNTNSSLCFNSPNFAKIQNKNNHSPFYEDLSFSYKSLNKIEKEENKYKTLNIENNIKDEKQTINQIYKNENLNNNFKKKINIIKKKTNSKDIKKRCKINLNDEKYSNSNINKSPILNYLNQMTKRNDSAPHIINHINMHEIVNVVSAERKKEKKINEKFFNGINLNFNTEKNNDFQQNKKIQLNKNSNKSNTLIIFSNEKNKNKKIINKNKIKNEKQKNNSHNYKDNKEKACKQKKLKLQPNKLCQNESKKLNDFKNKTSYNFFKGQNNSNNDDYNNYETLKKYAPFLKENHFSDLNYSFLEKSQKIDKNLINNNKKQIKYNIENNIHKKSNQNKIKLQKELNEIKNCIKNNNKYFYLSSARQINYNLNNYKNNDKIEKSNENAKKMKSFNNNIDKIINFCGNNKDINSVRNKYFDTCNNYKNKNRKKNENQKVQKRVTKEFEGLRNINISKIKTKQNNKNGYIIKYYQYYTKKQISNICFITKEKKTLNNFIYKKELLSKEKNKDNNINDFQEINGGICPQKINEFYNQNKYEIKKKNINEEHISIYDTKTFLNNKDNKVKKLNLNSKDGYYLKINKNNIKNQLSINTTSINEYRDLNKKLKFREQYEENSLINYYDEESEVTFGRKDHIVINNKTISNKKEKYLKHYDSNTHDNINYINNNTFCYNNNEYEKDNNKDFILDEESFVNGEVNFFNNTTFNPNSQRIPSNKFTYDYEINSITNNFYNSNNIFLISPQQKKLHVKYMEKGLNMLYSIILNYKMNIYKYLKNYSLLQKIKSKNESVIYTKKKLKDNGAKKYEVNNTLGSRKYYKISENNTIGENNENKINEKALFEKKKNNIIKKLRIRTRSNDYLIFDKNDKSIMKNVEIDLNNINNKKVEFNFNESFNTPKGANEAKANKTSPHFIINKKINKEKNKEIKKDIYKEINNSTYNKDKESKEKNSIERNNNTSSKKNIKNHYCTPKFCQIKPRNLKDIQIREHFNENIKCFLMEEILFFGSSNSSCFKENFLSNNFLSHCEEMLKYVEILDVNKIDDNFNINKYNINEKQNHNKYEIISLLNKITISNFDNILEQLNFLINNDNNNQYFFVKIIINKAITEKKYIELYAKLCFDLYNSIMNKAHNNKNNKELYSVNLGFDNDLKNILINECKLKFNLFISKIKTNEIQYNIREIKNKLFSFFDFIEELIYLQLILFDNAIFYLEKLYKEYINNNNGNNISILYLDLIIYFLDKTIRKIILISNEKNIQIFKKLIDDKIMNIFNNFEFLENYLKYRIINIKEKIKEFFDKNNFNNFKCEQSFFNCRKKEVEFYNNIYINDIIYNILLNNKKEANIKLLLLNNLENFLKSKNEENNNNSINYNWYIIDEIIFNIHIGLDDFILYYIEITKEIDIKNREYQYEYFELVFNYFIQYMIDDINYNKEQLTKKVIDIFLNICTKVYESNNENYFENLGFIMLLLINKNILSFNDINIFIKENLNIKMNISNIIKYVLKFDKEKYMLFRESKFFINNQELLSKIDSNLKYINY